MLEQKNAGVYQLDNGYWAFRYAIVVNGKRKECKKARDEQGNHFKTEKQATKARKIAIEKAKYATETKETTIKKTVKEVYQEYCEHGRSGKAYTTIKKQDSLWKNHLCSRFGSKYIEEITLAEIEDYLSELYYLDGRAYSYVESFLKMFYLIFGQAYSRNYMSVDAYNKMCINKSTKIHMPKMKVDEETDIVYFNKEEINYLDNYFKGTNAETAYMLGKYCGLRINECYGLKWSDINFKNGIISIERQMQYQEGLIKLVPLKTRNAKRKIYMCSTLKKYLKKQHNQMKKDAKELAKQRQQTFNRKTKK